MKATVERVSPTKALSWLEKNTHNRPVRKNRIARYAGAMQEGNWEANGDPIRFDKFGRLLDGQHRLESIVESDQSQECVVVTDLDPEVFSTIDVGARRTMADHLAVAGVKNHSRLAPAVPIIWHYKNGTLENFDSSRHRPHHNVLCDFTQEIEGLQGALHVQQRLGLYKMVSDSLATAVTWILFDVNRTKADEFLTHLCSDKALTAEHEQIRWLRDYLLNKKLSPDRPRRFTLGYEIFNAWNAWIKGISIKDMRRTQIDTGKFPHPKAR